MIFCVKNMKSRHCLFFNCVFDGDQLPKTIIPKTEDTFRAVLKVALKSKKEELLLKDYNAVFKQMRNQFLVGENIYNYDQCPVAFRKFQIGTCKWMGNSTIDDWRKDENYQREKVLEQYDFYVIPTDFYCIDRKEQNLLFYKKCKEQDICLVRTSRIFAGVTFGAGLVSRSAEEEIASVSYGGEAFQNDVLYEGHDWIFNQVDLIDYSTAAKEEW